MEYLLKDVSQNRPGTICAAVYTQFKGSKVLRAGGKTKFSTRKYRRMAEIKKNRSEKIAKEPRP
jgi:hypothetical protein